MSTVGGDIATVRARSSAPPTSAPSAPPTAPSTGQTEAYIDGKHWGPDAARQAGLAPPPTLRDAVAAWFPGMVSANPTYKTDQDRHPVQFNSPWPGSLLLVAASASLLTFRHRFAVQKVPFGAILVNPKTNKPVSQAVQAASPTQAGAKIGFGMPLAVIRDPTFAQESVTSVSLDEAISHWHTVYKGMAVGAGVLAGMAVWNVAFSPQVHRDAGTLVVGQMGEKR
ncbi:hypothetical protein BCR44DRAFT_37230 [Catenaria anguillulae PL171]|uniref:Uncharacterized protein n=1 Tax=Catenaria anguillulae PL171 TaxID=765915 RepID=A0A1Y2HDF8_9FUNG|nr:hypothetical protein BCR44DRAFT_37230 [Catenaria anguillulae PL171]